MCNFIQPFLTSYLLGQILISTLFSDTFNLFIALRMSLIFMITQYNAYDCVKNKT